MNQKIYNFSAGPATLPKNVLKQAQEELLDFGQTGMSVMELSHRSSTYDQIQTNAENDLRQLMKIPDNYKVLFLQGGASLQFAMVPLNLLHKSKKADYVITGSWSKKAKAQAEIYGDIHVAASSEDKNFSYIPDLEDKVFRQDTDYVHITTNNTIYGTTLKKIPSMGNIPLIADMSSNILSEEIDVSSFALIYAGAQKNIGPPGLTIVIIREDLIGRAQLETPLMLNYKTHADANSLYNTPPTFCIYLAGLVFADLLAQGGLKEIEKKNRHKAQILYETIDQSSLYSSPVAPQNRSLMNVPFILADNQLDAPFLAEAEKVGLRNLKGHRSIGGMRASIYNAMAEKGVVALTNFMKEFEKKFA